MFLAEMFFPFSVLAAGNSCLIMPLQIQQIQLLGRSRRHNLKHKLKIRQKVIWKFGVKLKGKQQSCIGLSIPRQYSCFPSRITQSMNSGCPFVPLPLLLEARGWCINSWPRGRERGGLFPLESPLSQGGISGATHKQGRGSQRSVF